MSWTLFGYCLRDRSASASGRRDATLPLEHRLAELFDRVPARVDHVAGVL